MGYSQQQESLTFGRPNLAGNYVNNISSYKKTGLWIDPNFVSMNIQFKCYAQPDYLTQAATADLTGTANVILLDLPESFVIANNTRIQIAMAALIITGIV